MAHKNLASERVRIGMTQTELANELGVSQQSILDYENGKRKMPSDFLASAASLFGCSVDYLLDRTPDRLMRKRSGYESVGYD